MFLILPIILFFLNTSDFPQNKKENLDNSPDNFSIYLIKQNWHTGIILKKEDVKINILPVIKDFSKADFLDIGWGDREFYLHPGFDFELAFKALFYPTPSVIRIQGVHSINYYLNSSDAAVEIKISKNSFDKLCAFISNSFNKNENKNILITERNKNTIKYYEAKENYSIFNTCNTWIAKGLKNAGFEIDDNIIVTQQIFKEVEKFSNVIKMPED